MAHKKFRTYSLIKLLLLFSFFAKAQQPKDFSFLTGSCAYIGPEFGDTSFYLYNGDTSIFYSMSQKEADFMLWLGDNWYLNWDEWGTEEGLRKKAAYARSVRTLQPLITKFPEYAIWDDHDYGPDQSQRDYKLKETSRQIFIERWKNNPSYGEDDEGIYTSFKKEDVLFILLDNRWWRDYDKLWRYKFFKPNPDKRMFGKKQMSWLKKQLTEDTTATFKIIVNGSQMLNPRSKGDCFSHFPIEYNDLLNFISANKISGVLFLSGDRHFSEIIKLERKNAYPLYDVTVSPLSAGIFYARGSEKKNKYRVHGTLIEAHNFAHFCFTGSKEDRKLSVIFFDKYGRKINEWSLSNRDVQN